jgi:hypothetical protein
VIKEFKPETKSLELARFLLDIRAAVDGDLLEDEDTGKLLRFAPGQGRLLTALLSSQAAEDEAGPVDAQTGTVADLTERLVAASSEWDDNTGDHEETSRPYLEHLAKAISSPEPEGSPTAADTRQARIDEALARCDHYQASGSAIAKEITGSIRAALHAPCPSCGAWGGCPACIPQADAEAAQ